MTTHSPLNGDSIINIIHSALGSQPAKQSAATVLSSAMADGTNGAAKAEDIEPTAEVPDGTNGATKTSNRATDPSQGQAPAPKKRGSTKDPLLTALQGLRSMNTRSR